jgi:acetyl-CoA C-acetyltransferase
MSSRDAVIVSAPRAPIGKAYRGAFDNTQPQELAANAIRHALARARVESAEIEDDVLSCSFQQGSTGANIARQAAMCFGGGMGAAVLFELL